MVFKIIAFSPSGYVRDGFNLLDGFIVIISIMDYSIFLKKVLTDFVDLKAFRTFKIFRTLKVLRMNKLLRSL
jgi:hypothetical protein